MRISDWSSDVCSSDLITASLGLDSQQVVGKEVRIPMARDGHFWADVELNGTKRRMLVDSGATVTALSETTAAAAGVRSEEHTSELQSLMRISYAVFCLKKKKYITKATLWIEHDHEKTTRQTIHDNR